MGWNMTKLKKISEIIFSPIVFANPKRHTFWRPYSSLNPNLTFCRRKNGGYNLPLARSSHGAVGHRKVETKSPVLPLYLASHPKNSNRLIPALSLPSGNIWRKRDSEISRCFFRSFFQKIIVKICLMWKYLMILKTLALFKFMNTQGVVNKSK